MYNYKLYMEFPDDVWKYIISFSEINTRWYHVILFKINFKHNNTPDRIKLRELIDSLNYYRNSYRGTIKEHCTTCELIYYFHKFYHTKNSKHNLELNILNKS